jgi:hypothetical protein
MQQLVRCTNKLVTLYYLALTCLELVLPTCNAWQKVSARKRPALLRTRNAVSEA